MIEFKVGMKVERIYGSHGGMSVGDKATVITNGINTVYLKEYPYGHSGSNLRILTSWKERYGGGK